MITQDSEHVKHSEGTIHIQVNLSVETSDAFHIQKSHLNLNYQREPSTQPNHWPPVPSIKDLCHTENLNFKHKYRVGLNSPCRKTT